MTSIAQRRRALQAADELLNGLDVDQESQIDVFGIVNQLGIYLVFNPLDALLGAILPKGGGGIMVTTQRRPAVQRYTVAHEVGHWILDVDASAFDTEHDIYEPSVDRERLAQIFAGQLLMPPPLVYATCSRYGISSTESASGPAVYLAARDMGASYEAAARQMENLEIINRQTLSYLLSLTPARIKTELCHGHRPDGGVDVWPVDITWDRSKINVIEGDELFVALPENRTTGYRWLDDNEIISRSHRKAAPPPAAFAGEHSPTTPVPEPEDLNVDRSSTEIKRSLARIPGSTESRRILPEQRSAAEQTKMARRADLGDPYSRWDTPATKEISPSLHVIDDNYQAGWAAIPLSALRSVRQAIAGRNDLVMPQAVHAYLSQPTTDNRTGLQASTIPVAATGYRFIALGSSGEGMHTFRLSYTSAVDPRARTIETYSIDVVVSPTPQVQRRRQIMQINLDEDSGDPGRQS